MLLGLGGLFIFIGLIWSFISISEDKGSEFALGVLVTVSGIASFSAGNYELGKDDLISKTAPTVEECQKELPRDEHCVMVAIPEGYLDKD